MTDNNMDKTQIVSNLFAMVNNEKTDVKKFRELLDRALEKGYKLTDEKGEYEKTHLISEAVLQGKIEYVSEILKRGYNINQRDGNGSTPIIAARSGEMIDYLIKKGADINAMDNFKMTLLAHAVVLGDADLSKTIIKKGAKTNTKHENGASLMHLAALSCDMNTIQLMMKQKLSINAQDKNGKTPMDYAFESEFFGTDEYDQMRKLGAKQGKDLPVSKPRPKKTSRGLSASDNQSGLKTTLANNAHPVNYTENESRVPIGTNKEIVA